MRSRSEPTPKQPLRTQRLCVSALNPLHVLHGQTRNPKPETNNPLIPLCALSVSASLRLCVKPATRSTCSTRPNPKPETLNPKLLIPQSNNHKISNQTIKQFPNLHTNRFTTGNRPSTYAAGETAQATTAPFPLHRGAGTSASHISPVLND